MAEQAPTAALTVGRRIGPFRRLAAALCRSKENENDKSHHWLLDLRGVRPSRGSGEVRGLVFFVTLGGGVGVGGLLSLLVAPHKRWGVIALTLMGVQLLWALATSLVIGEGFDTPVIGGISYQPIKPKRLSLSPVITECPPPSIFLPCVGLSPAPASCVMAWRAPVATRDLSCGSTWRGPFARP